MAESPTNSCRDRFSIRNLILEQRFYGNTRAKHPGNIEEGEALYEDVDCQC